MTIEEGSQEIQPEEMPGRVFDSAKTLYDEVEERGSKVLRIWGKRLVEKDSKITPGKTYYEVEEAPDDLEAHFDARIYAIKNSHSPSVYFNLNVYDFEKKDDKGRAKLIYYFTIKPDNIQDWRIEVLPY